eukprot:10919832-Alexandrium_andersonii.AAC.1
MKCEGLPEQEEDSASVLRRPRDSIECVGPTVDDRPCRPGSHILTRSPRHPESDVEWANKNETPMVESAPHAQA